MTNIRIATGLLLALSIAQAAAVPPLPALGAKSDGLTVSGISSGAYMAVQFQVAHSQMVKGAGIVAGGPYDCAEGSLWRALNRCMATRPWSGVPGVDETLESMETHARQKLIDPPEALADDKVWVLSGGADHTVGRPVVAALVEFYRHLLPTSAIRYVELPDAGHAMISVADAHANACATSEPPYINRCGDFDAAGELLGFLLGPLAPKAAPQAGNLIAFDQSPYIDGLPADAGLAEQGYAYVPQSCRGGGCRVHVAFHGCLQSEGQIGRRFVEGSGYNAWAESNRLVVLYPQTVARQGLAAGSWRWIYNPKACWDWWGYASSDYATRKGPQIKAVARMAARLAEAPGR